MFSRVASMAVRGTSRLAASRRLSSQASATLSQASFSTLRYATASVACLGGLTFAAQMQKSSPAMCAIASPFPYIGVPGTGNERSFIAIKPDGIQRQLVGEVITRFEKKGYKLVAMKMIWPTKEMASNHYADLSRKPFFAGLVNYFSSGPIVAMVWEGPDVILTGRKMLGATNPNSSDPGSIRGDYCIRVGRNLIHGSDGPDSAQHEIGMWFTEEECSAWDRTLDAWITSDN